ncbi:MAG: hypothetical protein EAZ81_00910 [Verrucomicrobia bacterium]|nr:MAG: hypothetical protein EAZ81_00910 [Verrucomicrobiota bacterium]
MIKFTAFCFQMLQNHRFQDIFLEKFEELLRNFKKMTFLLESSPELSFHRLHRYESSQTIE